MNQLIASATLGASLLWAAGTAEGAVYTVNNPAGHNGPGTLFWALEQAEANPGVDTVNFSVGTGPVTVFLPSSAYLAHQVIFDGSTQPGFAGTPIVSIDVKGLNPSSALTIVNPGCEVRSLAFVADTSLGAINVLANNCVIENCWFGLDHTLSPKPAQRGVVAGHQNISPVNTTINNCRFGNLHSAIYAQGNTDLQVVESSIGTDPTGTDFYPCTGSGIVLIDCVDTYIGPELGGDGNVIANCGEDGIGLLNSASTVVLGNRIFNVGQMAIDHGMDDHPFDFNDYQDADTGSGGTQNVPFISTATKAGGTIQIDGEFNSTPSTQFIVEFFASSAVNVFGRGMAEHRLGVATITTDATGDAIIDESLLDTLPGIYPTYISATVTRFDQSWGTSEMSSAILPDYTYIGSQPTPGTDTGWIPSGIDSGPEHTLVPDSIDDVDVDRNANDLQIIVRPSAGRFRVAGWTKPSLVTTSQSADVFRGKFYIYTTNAPDAPLNTVPNFRIRLDNEGVVLASNTYEYAATGNTAVPHEPYYGAVNFADIETRAGASLRPTNSAVSPSLYRIGFVPVVTPSSLNSNIGATFESYAGPDPADGTLALAEVQLAAYSSLIGATPLMVYAGEADFLTNLGLTDPGVAVSLNSGAFNVEADFQPGRRQALDLSGEVPVTQLAEITEDLVDGGTVLDTLNTPEDKIGVGIFNIESASDSSTPRIEPDKSYLALFVASSSMPAEPSVPGEAVQGSVHFQIQSAGGAMTSRLEVLGPAPFAGAPGSITRNLAAEALPGKDSQSYLANTYPFPDGENGGAYLVILPPLISQDIRKTTPGDLGPLADEPGPGVDAESYRDIKLAVNVIEQPTTMRLTPDLVVPWAVPNRARVRVIGVILLELPPVDDGGYIL